LRRTAASIVRFRLAMRSLLPFVRMDPPAPTMAVVFRDDNALTPYKPRARGKPMDMVAAYFSALPDVNYIVMAMGQREFTYHVVFHEYTHLLVNQNISRLPLWLNEGLADFFSTFDGSERDGRLIIGRPVDHNVAMLVGRFAPFPMSQFIDPAGIKDLYRDEIVTARFYAQSWALVHYLMLGDNGTHRAPLGTFMAALQNGEPAHLVFKRVFGEDFAAMDRALIQYVSLMQLPAIQVNPPEVRIAEGVAPLLDVDVEQLLGDLQVRTGALDEAARHLEKAAALDPAHLPTRLSKARRLIAEDKAPEALDVLSAPDIVGREDFTTVYLRAEAQKAARHFEEAEATYRHAVQLRPDFAFSYYGLSLAQLALDRPEASASFSRVLMLQPGAGWYFSRLLDSQRIGVDRFAIADAVNYVAQSGWSDGSSPYAMYIAALTYDRRKQPEKAIAVLEEIRAHVAPASWQATVASFLEGKLAANALLAKASSPGLLTEAHAYIGIKANIEGDRASAQQHLAWVRDKGDRTYTEYGLALGELDRMARQP
jgi:tetratricopeptide (TPR) repeat protein